MKDKLLNVFKGISINAPLLLGFIMVSLLLLVSIYPEYFSMADPYGMQRLEFSNKEGKVSILTPPIKPCKDYPWGTDEIGRDMKSLVIYGTKATIFIAVITALLRLAIAMPLAVLAAYKNKLADWMIKQFKIMFSAIPIAIAIIILSKISLFNVLIENSAIHKAIWIVLLGWSPLAIQLKQKLSEILNYDFVEGEIAIGKTKWEIAIQNVIPHIIPSVVVLFFMEVAMILLLISQIGVLGISLSGGYYNSDGLLVVSNEFDWSSLLKNCYLLFGSEKTWMVLYPALAFAFSIIGFNLLGEGLRIEFEKRTSMVITYLKKLPSFFSLKDFIFELKNRSVYKRRLIYKVITYILILIVILSPTPPSRYRLEAEDAMPIINELTQDKYGGRHTGSKGMHMAAEFVADKLKEYGVQPIDDSYIQNFDVPETYNIKLTEFKVYTKQGEAFEFENHKDYTAFSPINIKGKFEIILTTLEDLKFIDYETTMHYRDNMIMVDSRNVDQYGMYQIISLLSRKIKPKAVLCIQDIRKAEGDRKYTGIDKNFKNTAVIYVYPEVGDELLRHKELSADVEIQVDEYKNVQGYNVVGMIPGTNPELSKECIVIGSSLDGVGDDVDKRFPGALEAGAVALELQIAKDMVRYGIKPEKTIYFAFWDGTNTDYRGSKSFVRDCINYIYENCYYIDLKYMGSKYGEALVLNTSMSLPKSELSQACIKAFKNTARAKNIPMQYTKMNSLVLQDFLGIGKEALLLTTDGIEEISITSEDTYNNISELKLKEYGQVIFDTIVKFCKVNK